ncbi:uncharacterized protein LOC134815604 [Bolinopsis microptera]
MCRNCKDADKIKAKACDNFGAYTIDMEAVNSCPKAASGEFYYITKLACYNLSCYNLGTDEKTCFMWDQTQANRGPDEIGSCLLYILRNLPENITDVVIWADSCGGQNRNKENAAAILHFLNVEVSNTALHVKTVHLKYFERGHNESEVDTIHHMIEASKKNQEIYLPDRYKEIARSASTKNPIKVFSLASYEYPVYDVHALCKSTIINRNRYRFIDHEGKPKVNEASWLSAKRLSFAKGSRAMTISTLPDPERTDDDKVILTDRKVYVSSRASVRSEVVDKPQLTILCDDSTEIPVSERVMLGLIDLCEKRLIPQGYHAFYKSITTIESDKSDTD